MTQTTTPRPLTIAVEDVRRGDVIVTPEGVRCYAAFDLEPLASGDVKVWTAVRDQEAGRPSSLVLHAGTTVLIEGPEDLEDNDQDTEDRQVAGEAAAHAAEFGTTVEEYATADEAQEIVAVLHRVGASLHPTEIRPVPAVAENAPSYTVLRVRLADVRRARLAAAALLQAGYEVGRLGSVLTVTPATED